MTYYCFRGIEVFRIFCDIYDCGVDLAYAYNNLDDSFLLAKILLQGVIA